MMNARWMCLGCLLLAAATAVATDRGVKASIRLTDGSVLKGEHWVTMWDFEKIRWSLKPGSVAESSRGTEDIDEVIFAPLDPDYRTGDAKMKGGDPAAAVSWFDRVIHSPGPAVTRVLAILKTGECLARLERYEEAAQALDRLLEQYGDWIFVKDAIYQQGRYLLLAGQVGAARKRFERLQRESVNYGSRQQEAAALAKVGLADCLRAEDKHAKAAELLTEALQLEVLTRDTVAYAEMLRDLIEDYRALGQPEQVVATYRSIRYRPVPASLRAEAFLALAEDHHQAGRRIEAYDSACTAAVLARVGSATLRKQAKDLAKRIADELVQDPQLPDEDKREYKRYIQKL